MHQLEDISSFGTVRFGEGKPGKIKPLTYYDSVLLEVSLMQSQTVAATKRMKD